MAVLGTTDLGDGSSALAIVVNADPFVTAVDCPAGSLVHFNGIWYRKLDSGSSTNFKIESITSGSIQSGDIGIAVVQSGNIASGQIGPFHLASGAIQSGQIANGSIGSGQIASGAIGSVHIADNAVASGDLAVAAVSSGHIASGTVGTVHISSGGLGSGAIGSGQIGSVHIASGTIIPSDIASGGITSGKIADAAVTSGNISSGEVGWPHLASGSVRSGHVGDAAVVSGSYASGSIASGHLASGLLSNLATAIQSGQITSGYLGDASVVSGSIASGQVGWPHLASGAVRSGHIGNAAVLSGSIGLGQIASGHIASGLLTSAVRFRVVTNEAELVAAISDFATGGTIQLAGAITLTSNKSWDLSYVRIVSDRSHGAIDAPPARIIANGFTITFTGSGCYFEGVSFVGAVTANGSNDSQNVFLAAEGSTGATNRIYTFLRCEFRNVVADLTTTPVFDLDGLNGGAYVKNVTMRFDGCTQATTGMGVPPQLAGLIVDIGTTSATDGIDNFHMFVTNCPEGFWGGRSRWGGRKAGTGFGAWLWQDDTVEVVEYTNFSNKVSVIGVDPFQLVTSGGWAFTFDDIGKVFIYANTGGAASLTLAATEGTVYETGSRFELIRTGTQDVNLIIPAGVSVYWRGVLYTSTTIVITEPYGKAVFRYVADDVWQMVSSWNDLVSSGMIASGQVGWPHLASGAVRSGHVGDAAVASGSIASGAVGTVHVSSGGLGSGAIGSGQIGSVHIASGTIIPSDISSGGITSGKIADAAVTSGNISSGEVGWPHLASGAVRSGHVGDAAVTSGSVASGAVGRFHLSSGSINSGHIASGNTIGAPQITVFGDWRTETEPASPVSGLIRVFASDEKGFTTLQLKDSTGLVLTAVRDNVFVGRNTTGSTITEGTLVCVTGSTGNAPNIAGARADSLATMPCVGITLEDISNNAFGRVLIGGIITGIDTSAFVEGDPLFVSATTAGAFTSTAPLFPNAAQRIGVVIVSGVGNGSIQIILGNNANLTSGQVTSGAIGDNAIASGRIASGQIGWSNLSSGAVRSGHIGDAAVLSGSIGSGQVASGHMASGFIAALGSVALTSGQVSSGFIASGAVQGFFGSTRHIASGTVGVDDLGSGAVMSGHYNLLGLQLGNPTSGSQGIVLYRNTSGAISDIQPYTPPFPGEYGIAANQLLLSGGRFDFQPFDAKAEFRVYESGTTFSIFNIDRGVYYVQFFGSGAVYSGGGGRAFIPFNTQAISPLSGAFVVGGGAGFGGDVWASGAFHINSGNIVSGNIASGAIGGFFGPTRAIQSGSLGEFDFGSGAVVAGAVGSGAIVSGNIASGQIGPTHLVSGFAVANARAIFDSVTFIAAETISGDTALAVVPNQSGELVIAMAAVSGRMPSIGFATANVLSGQPVAVWSVGAIQTTLLSGLVAPKPIFVAASGALTTSAPAASGNVQQRLGLALNGSGGFFNPSLSTVRV